MREESLASGSLCSLARCSTRATLCSSPKPRTRSPTSPTRYVLHPVLTLTARLCIQLTQSVLPQSSSINPEHLSFFKFVGRIIGKALHDQRILEAYFSRSVYKHMLGKRIDHNDLESIDPEYHKSLVWMLENDIDGVLDLTFSVERDDFGVTEIVDLIPNGRDIAVDNDNKAEYVRLIADQRLSKEIKDQIGVSHTTSTSIHTRRQLS